jgi:hypothetical protein
MCRILRIKPLVKNDLKLKPNKKNKSVPVLTKAQKAARVQKCQQLIAWHVGVGDDINFTDEKLFLLQKTKLKNLL